MKITKPNILTALSIGGILASDALFIYTAKQEAKKGECVEIKDYILPIGLSLMSVGCIIGNHYITKQQKAILATGSLAMAKKLSDYRKATIDTVGEDKFRKIEEELYFSNDSLIELADKADRESDNDIQSEELFYMPQFKCAFSADPQVVGVAELNFNQKFVHDGCVRLCDLFDFLKLSHDKYKALYEYGEKVGYWFNFDDFEDGTQFITFNLYSKKLKNGMKCNYILLIEEPMPMKLMEEYY